MKISIIVPCFNAVDKIGRCFASLRAIDLSTPEHEVLFVDDCSDDGTYELIKHACENQVNWHAIRLERNSGSPSKPRNRGIEIARGDYLFFLDCDDEILPAALKKLIALAEGTDACIVRSETLTDNGSERRRINQLEDWSRAKTQKQRSELIITRTSTVPTGLVKRSFLMQNQIRWREDLRMGEDSVFLAEALVRAERIEYLAEPTSIYFKLPARTPATTQLYGRRELQDHLKVWPTVQALMQPFGINYYTGRLHVGLRVALEAMIFRNRGDIDEATFLRFHKFILSQWPLISAFKYTHRLAELLASVYAGDFGRFCSLLRPRLLIAGYDLKFIRDAMPSLAMHFDIRLDEWPGHEIHNEKQSEALLDWAEYIWCEWLLRNAEWYASKKRANQRLVVRMHRMELARAHGERLDARKVDAVIAVSPLFFERLFERFPNIPRHKARMLPNYVRVDEYRTDWHSDRLYTLGIIGILPSRKGYLTALKMLRTLRDIDERFRLEIFGYHPEELAWVSRDHKEMQYFKKCDQYIEEHNLRNSLHFNGHVDLKSALASRRVGYVLSVSDSDHGIPGFESFHLAIADGFSALSLALVRRWPGAEYLWPKKFLFDSNADAIKKIIFYSKNPDQFKAAAAEGREAVRSLYSLECFARATVNLFRELI